MRIVKQNLKGLITNNKLLCRMVRSRLRKKILVKLDASGVWAWFRAVRINLAALSRKTMRLIFISGLIEAGCK